MKLRIVAGNIFVKTVVNGHAGWMMVDTGCSGTSFDKGFTQRAGLTTAGYGQGYDTTTGLGKIPLAVVSLIDIGPIRLKGLQCAVIDYGLLQRTLKMKFIGILGAELFQNRLILLDVPRGRLACVKTVPRSFIRNIPIRRFTYDRPVVEVMVDGMKISALVDTGNAKTPVIVHSQRMAMTLRRRYPAAARIRHSGVTGKKRTGAAITCPVLFAGRDLPATTVVLKDGGSIPMSGARVQGNIGLPLLRDRQFILDYSRRLLHFKP